MLLPEQRARQTIDQLLSDAGWILQDRDAINLRAGRGVAVREFPLKTGFADYLLFVDRKAIGAVEAKPEGTTLSGVGAQSEKYSVGLPDVPAALLDPERRGGLRPDAGGAVGVRARRRDGGGAEDGSL